MRLIEKVWRSNDPVFQATRLVLTPFAETYRVVTAARGWMYDHGVLPITGSAIPVVSVGNLSVGGTGKTPFAAWLAAELAKRGARPAVVLRGYGGDEPLVHAHLNPHIPVIIEKRRVNGIADASQLGATVAILDDAFQHRAAERTIDIALLSAEQWEPKMRLLPAGPWREPLSAVRRAAIAVITRKTAASDKVSRLRDAIIREAPGIPVAVVHFGITELRRAARVGAEEALPLSAMKGRPVIAVGGIANSNAFFQQLRDAGGDVVPIGFPDHHRYTSADVSQILAAGGAPDALVVCTLKDAVKLDSIWPATAPPLWYVLQRLEIESGGDTLEKLVVQLTPKIPADE
ncbi:MAG TPA: tetraacyldisaccharide 4'-kinase [Gemmatimonadaceae bacterium]|nr:tetraacyldisaccharide 4'-kinase [Gemmatimonadaceae bacterium]